MSLKQDFSRYYGPKYGRRAYSNVKWTYNLTSLKKWIFIIIGTGVICGVIFFSWQEIIKNEQLKANKIEAESARKNYLQKRLERIKQETIAAEQKKIDSENKVKNDPPPILAKPDKEPKIYSWINEKGDKVYSNKKPSQ